MPTRGSQEQWIYIELLDGPLQPGFRIAESDVADFSIISNSAGGPAAKDYTVQLQLILEALTEAQMVIERVEVDSREMEHLPLDQRILRLDFPLSMAGRIGVPDLRRALTAAQKRIGRRPGERGGDGNRRIRIHITSNGISPDDLVGRLCTTSRVPLGLAIPSGREVIREIHTLTRFEIDQAIFEWIAIGRDAFFERYGAHKAFRYLILVDGTEFDAKAVVVGALKRSRPHLGNFKAAVFNGNVNTIAMPLRRLGFDIVDLEAESEE